MFLGTERSRETEKEPSVGAKGNCNPTDPGEDGQRNLGMLNGARKTRHVSCLAHIACKPRDKERNKMAFSMVEQEIPEVHVSKDL